MLQNSCMTNIIPISVSCTSLSDTILLKAQMLAKKLNFLYCQYDLCDTKYILTFTDDRLELTFNSGIAEAPPFSPMYVDFLKGSVAYRHARNCTTRQPLARAVGIKPGFRPDIFDATAGLGGDGFVLACLGCKVTLNERSPIIAALLEDGLARAESDPLTAEIISSKIELLKGDSQENLKHLDQHPYTVYLDPMYPHSPKSALNKKEMRMIREIVGDDTDASNLLETALAHAANRVVVKRPKGAEKLSSLQPSHSILMKNSRFDVYLTHHL